MDDKEKREKELFQRKNDFNGYRICPRCGSRLEKQILDHRPRLKCVNRECDFVYYHNPAPAAGALVIQEGKILLVKRAVAPREDWWCIPAGFMEWAEHPRETAVRELQEETGVDIRIKELFEVYSGDDDFRTNAVLILYLASIESGHPQAADDAKEVGFFEFDSLPDRIAFISHRQALDDYRRRYLRSGDDG